MESGQQRKEKEKGQMERRRKRGQQRELGEDKENKDGNSGVDRGQKEDFSSELDKMRKKILCSISSDPRKKRGSIKKTSKGILVVPF